MFKVVYVTEICMFEDDKDPSQQKDPTRNWEKKPLGIVNECMPWQKDVTSVLPTSVSELCMILQEDFKIWAIGSKNNKKVHRNAVSEYWKAEVVYR